MVQGSLHLLPVKFKCTCVACWQPGEHTYSLVSGTKLLGYLCPECLGAAVADREELARWLRCSARQLSDAAELVESGRLTVHLAVSRQQVVELAAGGG